MELYQFHRKRINNKKWSFSTLTLGLILIFSGNSCKNNHNSAANCDYDMFEFGCNYKIFTNIIPDKFGKDEAIIEFFSDTSYQLVSILSLDDSVRCATYLDRDWNRNGKYTCISKKNIVLVSGEYSKDKRNSAWRFYFPDGKLKRIQNYYNDKPIGSDYIYNTEGMVTRYCMVGSQAKCLYLSRYSSDGTVISDVGKPTILLIRPKSQLQTNEIFQFNILTAQAPHLKVSLIDAKGFEDGKVQIDLIRDGIYLITLQFNKPGEHQIKWVMKASKQGEEFTFIEKFNFVVVGTPMDNPTQIGSIN